MVQEEYFFRGGKVTFPSLSPAWNAFFPGEISILVHPKQISYLPPSFPFPPLFPSPFPFSSFPPSFQNFPSNFQGWATCPPHPPLVTPLRTVKNWHSLLIQVLSKALVPISLQCLFNKLSFQFAVFYTCGPVEITVCSHRIQLPDVPLSNKSCFHEIMAADLVNTNWKVMGSNLSSHFRFFHVIHWTLKFRIL